MNDNYSPTTHAASLSDGELRRMLATIPTHAVGSPLHCALLEEAGWRGIAYTHTGFEAGAL